jgi:hypothetical protein
MGFCSRTVADAQKEICIFAPTIATLEEVLLVLNPIYNDIIEDAFELIIR